MNNINTTETNGLCEIRDGMIPATSPVADDLIGPPRRVQLSRRRGWRKPDNTVVVARPTKWGNPFFALWGRTVEQCVDQYEKWLKTDPRGIETLAAARRELRGKSLA